MDIRYYVLLSSPELICISRYHERISENLVKFSYRILVKKEQYIYFRIRFWVIAEIVFEHHSA